MPRSGRYGDKAQPVLLGLAGYKNRPADFSGLLVYIGIQGPEVYIDYKDYEDFRKFAFGTRLDWAQVPNHYRTRFDGATILRAAPIECTRIAFSAAFVRQDNLESAAC
jgi:hypothetical protein